MGFSVVLYNIELNSTPTLHIDLSDKNKENIAIMSYRIDEMTNQLIEYEKKMKFSEEHIKYLIDEVKLI